MDDFELDFFHGLGKDNFTEVCNSFDKAMPGQKLGINVFDQVELS